MVVPLHARWTRGPGGIGKESGRKPGLAGHFWPSRPQTTRRASFSRWPLRQQRCAAAGGATVCDAVQAVGRVPCTAESLGADVLILSAHKIGGPKGAGALAFADENSHIGDVVARGGGQERGQRAGTENVAAIAGFGAAARTVMDSSEVEANRMRELRDRAEEAVLRIAPQAVIFGSDVERLPNTSAFAVPGVSAETLLMALDLDGVAVSSGSACSSGKVGRSHVLAAMGVEPELAGGAIRVSFGWSSS